MQKKISDQWEENKLFRVCGVIKKIIQNLIFISIKDNKNIRPSLLCELSELKLVSGLSLNNCTNVSRISFNCITNVYHKFISLIIKYDL